MGLTASSKILLVATGETRGHAPAMVYSTTDRLVALDPRTGAKRWALSLADDGQSVPAVVAGDRVIVAEADGTVVGLDARSGARRWRDQPSSGCIPDSMPAGLMPAAVLLPGVARPTVVYQCTGRQQLARLDPESGAIQWTWPLPAGWRIQDQVPAGMSPASAASGVLGLVASGRGSTLAPVTARSSLGPSSSYATDTVVAVDTTSGKPLWQITGVPVSAAVYTGGGQLCVASRFGVACYAAGRGTLSWQWHPPVTPSGGGTDGPLFDDFVADAGRLYLAAPTAAARSIPAASTSYRSPAGAFELREIDLATGRLIATTSLPAFYRGPSGVVVSADSPPGVVAVSGREVFVSPQLHGTQVIEAFRAATHRDGGLGGR